MNTLKIKFYIIISLVLILLGACKEKIDIDLEEADPTIVIEAIISNVSDSAIIKVSKTSDYMDLYKESIVDVQSALFISGDDTILCERMKNGYYSALNTFKDVNKSYKMEIVENGEKYTATSYMKPVVSIDSIKITDSEIGWDTLFDPTYDTRDTLHLTFYFKDPAEDSNYYRLKVYVNDTLIDDTDYTFDDSYFSGKTYPLKYESQKFKYEDKVFIEFIQYDKPTYTFFYTMFLAMGQQAGGTPFNPVNNIDQKKVYGYFAAYSADTITIPLKEMNKYLIDNNAKSAVFGRNTFY